MARRVSKVKDDPRALGSYERGRGSARRLGSFAADNPVAAGGWLVMALTAGLIIANATSFQAGPHPSPLFATRPVEKAAQERLISVRTSSISAAPLVRDVQIELRRLGFYEGLLDGLNGPATERAVRAYQRSRGLPDTGRIDEALLARLALDFDGRTAEPVVPVPQASPRSVAGAPSEPVPAPRGDTQVLQLQKLLADLGYGPLEIDGIFGDQTADAIRRFEIDRSLPVTGEMTERVFAELENLSGRKLGE
ncbi:peptidoglycan-binding protein [Stappia sp. F7233]|uniref:Peptidoglycan-binding protein n=1 Tax=Stappia albiluteola TaxID=2758565 RepID=A0A839AJ38_9HYPH|nr:peptidoglycan-binding protein [Stappia albiluteola]MBA5779048.1 peptidoglycan-binding protein [Stappia albiluteola]